MPSGCWFSISGVPASSIASAYSFDMIEAKSMPRFAIIGASGRFSTNLTVRSSTFSIDWMRSGIDMPLKYSQAAPET